MFRCTANTDFFFPHLLLQGNAYQPEAILQINHKVVHQNQAQIETYTLEPTRESLPISKEYNCNDVLKIMT